jgi:dTMP kinase
LNLLRQVTLFATSGLVPDLTFYLDVDVAEGLRRKRQGHAAFDRLDAQTLEFHERVRQGYLALAAQEPARWVMVDAAQAKEVVTAELCRRLDLVIRRSSLETSDKRLTMEGGDEAHHQYRQQR